MLVRCVVFCVRLNLGFMCRTVSLFGMDRRMDGWTVLDCTAL